MSTAIATKQHSLVTTMANRYEIEPTKFLNILEKTIFPANSQPSVEQMAAFLVVANQYQLNPFIKEIYAFPSRGGGIVPIVAVDGWLTIINRQPQLDGIEFQDHMDSEGYLSAVTARIYRKDRAHATEVTEYMNECKRNTDTWKTWPARMLRHKALIQCARYAFGLAGIFDPDEAERIAEAEAGQSADRPTVKPEDLKNKLSSERTGKEPSIDAETVPSEPESQETAPEPPSLREIVEGKLAKYNEKQRAAFLKTYKLGSVAEADDSDLVAMDAELR